MIFAHRSSLRLKCNCARSATRDSLRTLRTRREGVPRDQVVEGWLRVALRCGASTMHFCALHGDQSCVVNQPRCYGNSGGAASSANLVSAFGFLGPPNLNLYHVLTNVFKSFI